jgi:hypothetical protein
MKWRLLTQMLPSARILIIEELSVRWNNLRNDENDPGTFKLGVSRIGFTGLGLVTIGADKMDMTCIKCGFFSVYTEFKYLCKAG